MKSGHHGPVLFTPKLNRHRIAVLVEVAVGGESDLTCVRFFEPLDDIPNHAMIASLSYSVS